MKGFKKNVLFRVLAIFAIAAILVTNIGALTYADPVDGVLDTPY